MPQLSEFDKARILALYQDGYGIRAISRAIGFSKSTVHLWVKRMANEGHVTCRRRSGRPRSTTEDQDKSILRCVDEDPYRTKTEIKNILKLPVSRDTIRRRLVEQESILMNEHFPHLANQSQLTDEVESVCSVNMSVPDLSVNCPVWAPLATGQHDTDSVLIRNGIDGVCSSEGAEGSYQTVNQRATDDSNQFLVHSEGDTNASRQPEPSGGGGEEALNQQGPLHVSCEWRLENVVQTLTEQGTAINSKDTQGKTPLHTAIEKQQNGMISLLLCHPELDLTIRDETGLTPLAVALTYHNFKAAQAILDRMPTAAEQYDDKGQNLLHNAIQKGDMESVLFLLSNHVDVNSRTQDTSRTPPLHLAAAAGSEMLVTSLMLAGARVDDCDAHERTALHVAAAAGHVDIVSALLQNGADVNLSDSERDSALHIACREGHLDVTRLLLTESQLDAESANINGRNPLHELARASKDTAAAIADMIIKCIPHYPLDKPDLDGNTALLLAYMEGKANLCHTLVSSGASLGAMNKDGITIFDYQVATKQLLHSLLDNLSQEPHWTEGDICLECGIKFGQTVLKHHCHHCGRILCSKCSDKETPILKFGLNKPVRVCRVCFSVLQGAS